MLTMSKEIVAGRSTLKRSIKEFIIRLMDDGKDTRSFLHFRKQREAPVPPPWLFIFHGPEGLGKSTALHTCTFLVEDAAEEIKKTLHTISVDWENRSFNKGGLPATRLELFETIAQLFDEQNKELSGNFSSFRTFLEEYKKNSSAIKDRLAVFHLNQVLQSDDGTITPTDEKEIDFSLLSHAGILSDKEIDIHQNGEKKLSDLLVKAVLASSEETPLLLVLDSYHALAEDLDVWFREELFSPIARQNTAFIVFIGGSTSILRNFRNAFPEEQLFAANFADIPLTRHTIAQIASKMRVKVSDDDISRVEKVSAGVPLIVHDILAYVQQGITAADLLEDTTGDVHDAEVLSVTILNRFFDQCTEPILRERIFSLAMLSRFNAKAIAAIWNIPFSDVKHTLSDIEKQVSFIKDHQLHSHIRRQLRSILIQEAAQGSQSALKSFFVNFSSSNGKIFKELLTQLQTAVPYAEKRCHDPRYLSAIEQLVCGLMWSSPTDALAAFPGYYLELLHFNITAAQKLLAKVAEFSSLFSPVNEKSFKQLISGMHLADKMNIFKRTPVKPAEGELVVYLESVSESMNDFQRALMYHLEAVLDLRNGELQKAMENLDRSFSLLGNSSPEKTILYEVYVVLGHTFHCEKDHRNAINTFSNAVLIHADGFIPWYTMGISRMSLGEYEGAINTLNEAVKIDPYHTDAWYSLGLSYVNEAQHAESIDAFIKATEISPERPELWFSLGNSYNVLARHNDAVKAFRKVVLIQPENADAWILLGHSCSALDTSDEAIEAYQKAIDIKPRSIEPLRSLGIEYFNLNRFDEAIEMFTKASKINKNDAELWCFIAESHCGAGTFDKAISAGEKALSIDEKCARAWDTIGNAHVSTEHPDDAINAFKKAVEIEQEDADIWHKLGTIYTSLDEHDLAIDAFKKAVAFNPALKEVWYTIGKAYEVQKQFADAVAAYERGTQVDPENTDCWFHKGKMHQILEHYDAGFDSFDKVVMLEAANTEGWYNRGSCALKIGELKEAVDSFSKVVELEPDNADGWYQLGCSYRQQGNNQEAIRSFTQATDHDATRTDIWFNLGTTSQEIGMFTEAIQAYEKCIDLDTENPLYPRQLGKCCYSIEKYDTAHAAYSRAVLLESENLDTLYQLALTCHAQENLTEAIKHYSTITKNNPLHAEAQFNLALAYHSSGMYEQAVREYLTYVKSWPENGTAWFNLGLAYHGAEDVDNAITAYREAIKVTPTEPEVWYHLGIALHTKEQYGDAIQAYRKVLQYNSEHINAWFNLGMAYYIWENYTDAIDSYSSVVKLDPKHHTAWGNLAIACFADKNFKKGLEASKKAVELSPDEPWLIGNVIIATLFTGDSLSAQEFADKLLATDTNGSCIPQVIATITTALKDAPETSGAEVIIGKLNGTAPARETPTVRMNSVDAEEEAKAADKGDETIDEEDDEAIIQVD